MPANIQLIRNFGEKFNESYNNKVRKEIKMICNKETGHTPLLKAGKVENMIMKALNRQIKCYRPKIGNCFIVYLAGHGKPEGNGV